MHLFPRLRGALICVALTLTVAMPAAADAPTGGLLVTTADHLDPGATFTILGSRLDPGATVTFRLEGNGTLLALGSAQIGQDGSVSATFDVPVDFPRGDAYVRGRTSTGVDLALYVHVGPRAVSPGTQQPVDGPIDDRAIGLLLAGFGFVLLVIAGAWYWTGRGRRDPAPD